MAEEEGVRKSGRGQSGVEYLLGVHDLLEC